MTADTATAEVDAGGEEADVVEALPAAENGESRRPYLPSVALIQFYRAKLIEAPLGLPKESIIDF